MASRCSQCCWCVCQVIGYLDSQVVNGDCHRYSLFLYGGSNPSLRRLIAQLVEQQTHNLRVAGSIPAQKPAERHQGESRI